MCINNSKLFNDTCVLTNYQCKRDVCVYNAPANFSEYCHGLNFSNGFNISNCGNETKPNEYCNGLNVNNGECENTAIGNSTTTVCIPNSINVTNNVCCDDGERKCANDPNGKPYTNTKTPGQTTGNLG